MSIAAFMAACLFDAQDGYYATRPQLGGDFTTAPEISQMFGELLGLWAAHEWASLGAPARCALAELGPGRGVLMTDAWRALRRAPEFMAAAELYLIEASPPLQREQAARLATVGAAPRFLERLEALPAGPLLLLANEFLDCLPIRQLVRTPEGWRERLIGPDPSDSEGLAFGLSPTPLSSDEAIPAALRATPLGAVVELRPSLEGLLAELATRLHAHPGRALFFDYGPARSEPGDTLQAVQAGRKVSPLGAPGESDLSARVDFQTLAETAHGLGLQVAGPRGQGSWLLELGIGTRAARLAQAEPAHADAIAAALQRLTAPEAMGELFQAICLSSPGLPTPAGF